MHSEKKTLVHHKNFINLQNAKILKKRKMAVDL